LGKWPQQPGDLAGLANWSITEAELTAAMGELLTLLHGFPKYGVWPLDRTAKSPDFVGYLRST
jgi:hypothetical protein